MKFQVIEQEIYKYNFLYETSKNPSKIPKKVFYSFTHPNPDCRCLCNNYKTDEYKYF